jgi:hypothetical protein
MSVQFSNFKNSIKEFLKLDEEIRSLSKAKSERTKARDKLSKEIMGYYKTNNIHSLDLNFDGGKQQLELIESTRHPAVNKKFLREALVKYCNNDKIVDNMIDHILDERSHSSSVSFKLKCIIPKSKKSSSNPMKLTQKYENDKIKDRFAKLAEYAIIKDGIGPLKKTETNEELGDDEEFEEPSENYEEKKANKLKEVCIASRIDTQQKFIIKNPTEENKEKEMKEMKEMKEIKEMNKGGREECREECREEAKSKISISKHEDIDEDEEDVDLDEIPEEETGYTEPPPKIEEEIDQTKTFRTIISQKLDTTENPIGSIPQTKVIPPPCSSKIKNEKITNQSVKNDSQNIIIEGEDLKIAKFKELEKRALESWNQLKIISTKNPILGQWCKLQNEKMIFLNKKAEYDSETFNLNLNNIKKIDNKLEKELEKYSLNVEINNMRLCVIKYINIKFGISIN